MSITPSSPPNSSPTREGFFPFTFSLAVLICVVLAFKDCTLDANNIPSGSMIPTLKIGDYLFVNKMRYSIRLPFIGREIWRHDNPKRGDIITFQSPNPSEQQHYVKRVMAIAGDRIRLREIRACDLMQLSEPPPASTTEEDLPQKAPPETTEKRLFSCRSGERSLQEPFLSLLEYRVQDDGPWIRYQLEELSLTGSNKELLNSDNFGVLPAEYISPIVPDEHLNSLVYRERGKNLSHLIVESAEFRSAYELCPEIYNSGCVVPKERYFVMGDNRDDSTDSRQIGFIQRKHIYGKAIMIYFSANWRDQICTHYWKIYRETGLASSNSQIGFDLPNFPPSKQYRYCTEFGTTQPLL